jgi:chemotaxis family two-component system sensor kinase Cph1
MTRQERSTGQTHRCPVCSSSDVRFMVHVRAVDYWRCQFCAYFGPLEGTAPASRPVARPIGGMGFRQGDHICAVYDTREEQLAVAVSFISDGLRGGDRCLYAADSEDALKRFAEELEKVGLNAAGEQARGALLLLTKAQAHLVNGRFDSERMLKTLNESVEAALNDGFNGFRTCGDMSWLLDEAPGSEQVLEYEALVTELFRSIRGVAMCQYDRARLSASILDHGLATHSSVLIAGKHKLNPFHEPPALARHREAQPSRVAWKLTELRDRP